MTEPEDLLGKADALMARHRPGRAGSESYAEIPVLEEIVEFTPESDDVPVLTEIVEPDLLQSAVPEPEWVAPESIERELVEPDMLEPEPLPDEQAQREAQTEEPAASMRVALLAALQPEIDTLIEERLKVDLAPLVERLFNELRGDLQMIARDTLIDAINAAVERELERRKSDS